MLIDSTRAGDLAGSLAASLRARAALAAGRKAAALATLEGARWERTATLSITEVSDRYLRAALLQELGREEDAIGWYQFHRRASFLTSWSISLRPSINSPASMSGEGSARKQPVGTGGFSISGRIAIRSSGRGSRRPRSASPRSAPPNSRHPAAAAPQRRLPSPLTFPPWQNDSKAKSSALWARLKRLAFTDVNAIIRGLNASDLETMERTLIEADFGVPATVDLTEALEDEVRKGTLKTEADLREALKRRVAAMFDGADSRRRRRPRRRRGPHGGAHGRRQRHRQDHDGGQARAPAPAGGPEAAPRRGRHLPRRRHPAAPDLGRSDRRAVRRRARRAAIPRRSRSTPSTPRARAAPTPSSWTPPGGCTPRRD